MSMIINIEVNKMSKDKIKLFRFLANISFIPSIGVSPLNDYSISFITLSEKKILLFKKKVLLFR